MKETGAALFFRLFRRYRLLLLGLFVIFSGLAVYKIKPTILQYRGSCTFYMPPESFGVNRLLAPREEIRVDLWRAQSSYERVLQLVHSGQMMDYIIRGFDLYHHYGIDTLNPYFKELTINILVSRTDVHRISNDIMRVTVVDRNNEMAASMANTIVRYLDVMNRQYQKSTVDKDLAVYRSFITESEKEILLQQQKLEEALGQIKELQSSRQSSVSSESLQNMEFTIREAASSIRTLTENRISSMAVYTAALNQTDPANLRTVIAIKSALPETASNKFRLLLYGVSLGFIATIATMCGIYFVYYYKEYFIMAFGR